MSIEAMKQALEALEANQPVNYCMNNNGEKFPMMQEDPFRFERNDKAIIALRIAIEQAELVQRAEEAFERSKQYNATSDHQLMENAQGDLERVKLVQTGVGIGKPEQEPVAWQVMVEDEAMKEFPIKDMAHDWCVHQKLSGSSYSYWIRPLYTSPPLRQPLMDEEIDAATQYWAGAVTVPLERLILCREYARAIEAAIWEKQK